MELTRRDVLRGISAAGAMAVATESVGFSAGSRLAAGSSKLPWPRSNGSPVIDSLRPVIEKSRDVQTHYDKIRDVAGWMAYEELPLPNLAVPFGMGSVVSFQWSVVSFRTSYFTTFAVWIFNH